LQVVKSLFGWKWHKKTSWYLTNKEMIFEWRMALTLVDKVLTGNFKKPLPPPKLADGGGKRKRTESGSSSGSHRSAASSSRYSGADFLPTFTHGGSRGGGRGGGRGKFPAHFNKKSKRSGYDSRFAKSDPRRSGGDRSGNSSSGGWYGSRYNSGSGGGGGSYSRN
jgi:hypothetical protein